VQKIIPTLVFTTCCYGSLTSLKDWGVKQGALLGFCLRFVSMAILIISLTDKSLICQSQLKQKYNFCKPNPLYFQAMECEARSP